MPGETGRRVVYPKRVGEMFGLEAAYGQYQLQQDSEAHIYYTRKSPWLPYLFPATVLPGATLYEKSKVFRSFA
jgi:hypothetical protein